MQATGFPTWVTLGANGMKAIELPSTIREIIIAADADAAGIDAAGYARLRFLREGRRMRIVLPPAGCGDFNEVTT
jgi:DNA primase